MADYEAAAAKIKDATGGTAYGVELDEFVSNKNELFYNIITYTVFI